MLMRQSNPVRVVQTVIVIKESPVPSPCNIAYTISAARDENGCAASPRMEEMESIKEANEIAIKVLQYTLVAVL